MTHGDYNSFVVPASWVHSNEGKNSSRVSLLSNAMFKVTSVNKNNDKINYDNAEVYSVTGSELRNYFTTAIKEMNSAKESADQLEIKNDESKSYANMTIPASNITGPFTDKNNERVSIKVPAVDGFDDARYTFTIPLTWLKDSKFDNLFKNSNQKDKYFSYVIGSSTSVQKTVKNDDGTYTNTYVDVSIDDIANAFKHIRMAKSNNVSNEVTNDAVEELASDELENIESEEFNI